MASGDERFFELGHEALRAYRQYLQACEVGGGERGVGVESFASWCGAFAGGFSRGGVCAVRGLGFGECDSVVSGSGGRAACGECVVRDTVGVLSVDDGLSVGDEREEVECVGSLGVGVGVRGKHWKKNQKNQARRARKKKDAAMAADWRSGAQDCGVPRGGAVSVDVDSGVGSVSSVGDSQVPSGAKDELRASLEAKWRAKNALEEAKAKRQLELLQAQDVGQLKKLQERKVHSATERAMVAAEKAHATLRATGNVPGVVPVGGYEVGVAPVDGVGFCETVMECTISPDSSASMKEFRECQKQLEDLRAEHAALKARCDRYEKFAAGEEVAFTTKDGDIPESVRAEFERKYPGAYEYEVPYHDPDTAYVKKVIPRCSDPEFERALAEMEASAPFF